MNAKHDLLDPIIAAFEEAWQSGQPPQIADFLAGAPAMDPQLLVELVLVDLEFRWRQSASGLYLPGVLGGQPRLDDYARQFPQLGTVPAAAVAEEYRIRRLWGDRPNYDHYASRFPQFRNELVALLQAIDQELAADGLAGATPERESRLPITAPDPRAPLPFSDFQLLEHLGTGGMGKVYRAHQLSLDRPVALKALLKSRQHDPAAVERFLQEGKMLARLRHPNIVGVLGLGRFPGGGFFLVMDLVDGGDLGRRLAAGPVELDETLKIVTRVTEAIEFAHRRGIVHCDLKPGNVLLDERGNVFVSDFGLAQFLGPEQTERGTLAAGGTLAYMAPEQADAALGPTSAATDIYGIGGLLFHLVTGHPPPQASQRQCGSGHLVINPTAVGRAIPVELNLVCRRCLQADPADRFASATELAEALKRL